MARPDERDAEAADGTAAVPQRLDKWLWFARMVKTRTLAARLIADGKVRVNRDRIEKPAHTVRPGDVITAMVHARVRVLRVLSPGVRRGPPAEAQRLYEDLTPPPAAAPGGTGAELAAGRRERGAGRPTKRDRRRLDRMMGED